MTLMTAMGHAKKGNIYSWSICCSDPSSAMAGNLVGGSDLW